MTRKRFIKLLMGKLLLSWNEANYIADIVRICNRAFPKSAPSAGRNSRTGKIKQKIYCSFECQKAHAQRAAKRRYRDRKAAANDAGISATITCLVEG